MDSKRSVFVIGSLCVTLILASITGTLYCEEKEEKSSSALTQDAKVETVEQSEVETKAQPKRVYADVVGDLLHAGHIEFFKKAKAIGDYLIVGVNSDEDVASYKRVPILSLAERKAIVESCKYIDEVITAPSLRLTEEWIKENRIDYVVHGDDFSQDLLMDQYAVPLKMGIMRIVPYTKGISTTEIINRVKERVEKKDPVLQTTQSFK